MLVNVLLDVISIPYCYSESRYNIGVGVTYSHTLSKLIMFIVLPSVLSLILNKIGNIHPLTCLTITLTLLIAYTVVIVVDRYISSNFLSLS